MATAAMTQKPSNKNPQPENPNKNLAPNPTDIENPNRTHEANPSIQSEPLTDDFGRETAKRNGDDSRAKGIQSTAGAAVVSPLVGSGQAADVQKKLRRAERFGVPVQLSEEEKRNSRAERFGTGSGSSGATKTLEEGKRKARAERFGIPVQSVVDEDAKKKARLSRFAPVTKIDNLEEEKRKAREMRFSQPASGSKLYVNGKGNIVPKIAIDGKALGGA